MADNIDLQASTLASLPTATKIAARAVTYSGDANALIAPAGLVEFSGSDDAKVATDIPLGSILGATNEASAASDSATSGLNGLIKRLLARLTALFPAALGTNGGLKVDIVGDTGTQSILDTDGVSGVSLNTKSMMNGTTTLTPKFQKIAVASSGNNNLVAAVTAKKIRVLAYNFVANGTVNAKFQSDGAGTPADLTGLKYCVVNSGMVAPFNPLGWFESASGKTLDLNLSAGIAVGGELTYLEV